MGKATCAAMDKRVGKRRAYCVSAWSSANIDDTRFHSPDPESQGAIEDRVDGDCRSRVVFCVLEAQLIIPKEACASYEEGRIAESKSNISQSVGLGELQRVQVVGNGII